MTLGEFIAAVLAKLAWAACEYVIALLTRYYLREVIPVS